MGYLVEIIMTFTEEELLAWTVDKLKNYLTTRGVTVSGGTVDKLKNYLTTRGVTVSGGTVDKLKNYLTTRVVTVSGGGGRKADLI